MPRASVIITTHNRPQLVPRAVQSACASASEVEVIVVDDASADETAQVCKSLSGIKYVRAERNQQVAGARNIGLLVSRGEYIAFLDDDDTRVPGSLDMQIEALEREPEAGLIYGQAIYADQNCQPTSRTYLSEFPQGDVFWRLLSRNFIPCGSVVFRRSCLSRIGMLDDHVPGLDDWDLWIRIAEIYPIIAMRSSVIVWRQPTRTSGQGSSSTIDLIARSRRQFRERWLKLPRAANAPRQKRREAWREFSMNVSEHLAWETTNALINVDLRSARESALTLLLLHPIGLLSVAQRWTSISTLRSFLTFGFSHKGLANSKAHFKRIRSGGSER